MFLPNGANYAVCLWLLVIPFSRMGRNEPVRLEILGRICERLDCNIEDIIEYERGQENV